MRVRILIAAAAACTLSACGGPDETPNAETSASGESSSEAVLDAMGIDGDDLLNEGDRAGMDAIFEDNIPWDSDRAGVVKTDSGLEYIVLSSGEPGGKSPNVRDAVSVMYEGRLARTGEMFDSSYTRGQPAQFPLGGVIAGWTEGLQYMSEGDDVMFYIPADLAYGDNPRPGGAIQPGDDLVFRVELQEVFAAPSPRPVSTDTWAAHTPWNSELDGVQSTESGLEYVVIESGDAAGISPEPSDRVVVFYEGRLDDGGETFDSAFQRGEPEIFPAGGLVPGFVEALSLMKPGDRWLVHIPSDLAYGPGGRGPIPPNSALNFEIELVEVLQPR